MKYPRFLKENDTIGITALSSGTGERLSEVRISLNHLKEHFKLIVTPNVWGDEIVSSPADVRIKEFNELLNEDISGLLNLRGGDFSLDTIHELDYEKIIKKRLLTGGFSDTTSFMYILTTKYDYATIYGANAKNLDNVELEKYQLDFIEYMKGNLVDQTSYHDRDTHSVNGDFTSNGVLIGGCLDVIRYLFGTEYDGTNKFIEKYKDKKIIWHFDIFAMGSVDTYLTLLQMKNMGYFKYSDTFIFGTVKYPKIECDLSYEEAFKKVLGDKNIVVEANIGHVVPRFTILNGSFGTIEYKNKELRIKQELMYEDNG